MRMIDEEYESVTEAIEAREREILRQLLQYLVDESAAVSKLVAEVARVDALLSLAFFAHNCNLVQPEMVDNRSVCDMYCVCLRVLDMCLFFYCVCVPMLDECLYVSELLFVFYLDAFLHLYKRVCPSVCLPVETPVETWDF